MAPKQKKAQPNTEPLSEEDLLTSYTNLLTSLSEQPNDASLHLQHISLTKALGDPDGLEGARELMRDTVGLGDEQWLDWIENKKKALEGIEKDDIVPYMTLIELYQSSIVDYLSIPLLLSFSEFLISTYYLSQGLSAPTVPEEEEDEDDKSMQVDRKVGEKNEVLSETLFGLESLRGMRDEVLENAKKDVGESQKVWKLWIEFEMDLLKMNPASDDQIQAIDTFYLSRLSVVHLGMEETFSSYSRFVTTHLNHLYSDLLPSANKLYAPAHTLLEEREIKEIELRKSGFTKEAFLNYLSWEREVRKVNIELTEALFERAVARESIRKGSEVVWKEYAEFAKGLPKARSATIMDNILSRAVKAIPSSSTLWCILLRHSEKNGLPTEAIDGIFKKAMETRLIETSVEDLVRLYEERAGVWRREIDQLVVDPEDMEPDAIDPVVSILQEGMELIEKATKGKGDPQLRLEKNLSRQLERFSRIEDARALWQNLSEARSRSYMVWYLYADFETRHGTTAQAHKAYSEGCSAKHLDYPEYLLQSWLTFEVQNGSLEELEYCEGRYKRQMKGLEALRTRQAAQQAQAQPQQQQVVDTDSFITEAVSTEVNEKKRERSPATGEEGTSSAKKVRVDAPASAPAPAAEETQKRDRENSTVFVIGDKEAQLTEEGVKKFFRECGEIRELKHKTMGEKDYAMIEFMEKESVLAAQTRDKKKINGVEVDVHVAWKSCLYITNFPDSFDKDMVTKLFSEYGVIFDTRWPSKRYKTNRRFCYVQFTTPADAEAALALHNKELEPGLKLIVYISDPGRKKDRSDQDANNKELYVAGLSKHVEEHHLRKLFEPFGTIKGVRVVKDDKGLCKGFAFIDYEEESSAQAALSLNNHEYKKRHMSVTIAQARNTGIQKTSDGPKEQRSELQARRVRVRNIPPGTEEAIVQQTFEKVAAVKVVTMTVGATDAIVEFKSPAEQGKALMNVKEIQIEGTQVDIYPDGPQARTADGKKPTPSGVGAPLLPRQATRSRGRVGLGFGNRGRGRGGIGMASARAAAESTSEAGTSGDQVMAPPVAETSKSAGAKSQDDFRAMLMKK